MKKETKLYGSTATYLQELEVNEPARKISETYEVAVEELAQVYSDMKNVPTQLNKDKKFEIQALARAYLKAQPQPSPAGEFPEAEFHEWLESRFALYQKDKTPIPMVDECARWGFERAREMSSGGEPGKEIVHPETLTLDAIWQERYDRLKTELEQAKGERDTERIDFVKLMNQANKQLTQAQAIEKETTFRLMEAHAEAAKYKAALENLVKESAGLIQAHELALEMDHGNSNMACLNVRITEAREALTEPHHPSPSQK